MKNSARVILALVAAAVISPGLASALTVTITQVRTARNAVVVTFSNSPAPKHWAESIAAEARGGIELFVRDLPAGLYSAVVLACE